MAILQTIRCDICDEHAVEKSHGDGFVGWGTVQGFKLNDTPHPCLCPRCLAELIPVVVAMREKHEPKAGG